VVTCSLYSALTFPTNASADEDTQTQTENPIVPDLDGQTWATSGVIDDTIPAPTQTHADQSNPYSNGYKLKIDPNNLDENALQPLAGASDPSFDMRAAAPDQLTAVKHQQQTGTCWAHAAIASEETSILRNKANGSLTGVNLSNSTPLSRMQLIRAVFSADVVGTTPDGASACQRGGNYSMVISALSKWYGPALESDYPWADSSVDGDANCPTNTPPNTFPVDNAQKTTSLAHLKTSNVYLGYKELTSAGGTDNQALAQQNLIKQSIYKNGSLAVIYNADATEKPESPYWDNTHFAQFRGTVPNGNDGDNAPNHGVAVIGWDDNFAIANFNALNPPPSPGAWLIRNSWGTGTNNGYFWLSYYDGSIMQFTSFEFAPTNNYDVQQSYDNNVGLNWVSNGTQKVYGSNIFTVPQNGGKISTLNAVSAYLMPDYLTGVGGGSASISVYKNVPAGGAPTSGQLAWSTNYTGQGGYITLDIPSAIDLAPGTRYAVVVKADELPQEAEITFVHGISLSINSGESYYSPNGSSWADVKTLNSSLYNFNIRGFLKNTTRTPSCATLNLSLGTYPNCGNPVTLYRAAKLNGAGYFYTMNYAEYLTVSQFGMRPEGAGYQVSPVALPGLVPVYRAAHLTNGGYFYTMSLPEFNTTPSYGYRKEGVAFYVSPSAVSGSTAVYRGAKLQGGYFYTMSVPEYNTIQNFGMRKEGLAWYAW
jgi:C1A family cysteine protease